MHLVVFVMLIISWREATICKPKPNWKQSYSGKQLGHSREFQTQSHSFCSIPLRQTVEELPIRTYGKGTKVNKFYWKKKYLSHEMTHTSCDKKNAIQNFFLKNSKPITSGLRGSKCLQAGSLTLFRECTFQKTAQETRLVLPPFPDFSLKDRLVPSSKNKA